MTWVATAVAVSSTLLSVGGQYMAAQDAEDAAALQRKLDQQKAQAEIAADSAAESSRAQAMRDEARRNRASIEAGYATSGVELSGSAADILTKQVEVDELNVQREHAEGNRRRQLMDWGSGQQSKLDSFASKQRSRAASFGVVSGIGKAASSGMTTYKAWV
jgi:hypothetical protein